VLIPFLLAFFAVTSVYLVKNPRRKEASIADTRKPVVMSDTQAPPSPEVAAVSSEPEASTDAPAYPVRTEGAATDTLKNSPIENPKVVKAQRGPLSSKATPPATPREEPRITNVVVRQPEPEPPPPPIKQVSVKEVNAPLVVPAPVETTPSYKSARLLIASVAVPEPFTIIVNVDNELFYSRNATSTVSVPIEDRSGKNQLQSLQALPSIPLSEERPLPPGKHKVQVNVMMASRRLGKVQEITEKFISGQRRILEIDFIPENQSSHGRDPSVFKITLK
jgi:hypothetical protein